MNEDNNTIFPTHLAIRALKSTAYNNSAYALSEIVDNAYDAKAKDIHIVIICEENTTKPKIIAILDNGNGMNSAEMRRAIQYGNGSKVGKPPTGLGRFGVGLLSATFNQCESLEMWSWQNGLDMDSIAHGKAPKVSLDIPNIHKLNNVLPDPDPDDLPDFFEKTFNDFPDIENNMPHGTLVVWRNFHNLSWQTADTLRRHLAFECGRIYRNYLADNKLKIVLSVWDSTCQESQSSDAVGVVDPMFLLPWSGGGILGDRYDLGPFNGKPMFMPHGEIHGDDCRDERGNVRPKVYVVKSPEGHVYGKYRILASRRSPDVVQEAQKAGRANDPGQTSFGQMARRLEGVSILREGREIMLDARWLQDQTIDRWISVSIDFDSGLDEIFGVSNNKQQANYLSELARFKGKRDADDIVSVAKNPYVLSVAQEIFKHLDKMRLEVQAERKGVRKKGAMSKKMSAYPEFEEPENLKLLHHLLARWSKRHSIPSDTGSFSKKEVMAGYTDTTYEGMQADKVRPLVVEREDLKVDFVSEPNGGGAFFRVHETSSTMIVKLNQDHPMYEQMVKLLRSELSPEKDNETPEISITDAIWLIKQMLYCYARAECEAHGAKKEEFESVRLEWGRIARVVMEGE